MDSTYRRCDGDPRHHAMGCMGWCTSHRRTPFRGTTSPRSDMPLPRQQAGRHRFAGAHRVVIMGDQAPDTSAESEDAFVSLPRDDEDRVVFRGEWPRALRYQTLWWTWAKWLLCFFGVICVLLSTLNIQPDSPTSLLRFWLTWMPSCVHYGLAFLPGLAWAGHTIGAAAIVPAQTWIIQLATRAFATGFLRARFPNALTMIENFVRACVGCCLCQIGLPLCSCIRLFLGGGGGGSVRRLNRPERMRRGLRRDLARVNIDTIPVALHPADKGAVVDALLLTKRGSDSAPGVVRKDALPADMRSAFLLLGGNAQRFECLPSSVSRCSITQVHSSHRRGMKCD